MTAVQAPTREQAVQPRLLFFTSSVSGHCRRVEGFLAQVLQRRRNHGTFRLTIVDAHERPELLERFDVGELPTLLVVADNAEQARLERPRGCRDIESLLRPWLR
jgi:thioredoxin-like negative regulator of GroEL